MEQLTLDNLTPADPAGYRSGHHPDGDPRLLPSPEARECRACGRPFHPTIRAVQRGYGHFCSRACIGHAPRSLPNFITPEGTPADRVRAQGLLNKRQKLGWFKTPAACMKCFREVKLDKHHPDYSKPDEILWLCRSCHMKTHHHPQYISGLVPVKLDGSESPAPAEQEAS